MKKTVKNIENAVIFVQKLTQIDSTIVENVRQISFFMQNKPNFPHFSPENEDCAIKQTQFKPNTKPIKANICLKIRGQTQTNPIPEVLMSLIWSHNISGPFENSSGKFLHPTVFILIVLVRRKYVTIVSLGEIDLALKKGI